MRYNNIMRCIVSAFSFLAIISCDEIDMEAVSEIGYDSCNVLSVVNMAEEIVTFNDKTVSTDQTIAGWNIQSENVTVENGAKLTFNVGESITINAPFTVNLGSQIEILGN